MPAGAGTFQEEIGPAGRQAGRKRQRKAGLNILKNGHALKTGTSIYATFHIQDRTTGITETCYSETKI